MYDPLSPLLSGSGAFDGLCDGSYSSGVNASSTVTSVKILRRHPPAQPVGRRRRGRSRGFDDDDKLAFAYSAGIWLIIGRRRRVPSGSKPNGANATSWAMSMLN
ncbi:unnamed protein product [Mycena citricolor]|uniref:Uncharacterized protein n=1 Tax=Mycena citricolor TaxID=2018698 RepID=A0AAD2HU06_9AGAR|nr:unnamed protein product [Mycena citricolor]CAK5282239.1 unnamed protein product [Mycena citricolor]CAK5284043.1 unnamed protein product [Mycena citricolor]